MHASIISFVDVPHETNSIMRRQEPVLTAIGTAETNEERTHPRVQLREAWWRWRQVGRVRQILGQDLVPVRLLPRLRVNFAPVDAIVVVVITTAVAGFGLLCRNENRRLCDVRCACVCARYITVINRADGLSSVKKNASLRAATAVANGKCKRFQTPS